jgi:hypothetical protein
MVQALIHAPQIRVRRGLPETLLGQGETGSQVSEALIHELIARLRVLLDTLDGGHRVRMT